MLYYNRHRAQQAVEVKHTVDLVYNTMSRRVYFSKEKCIFSYNILDSIGMF